MRCKRCGAPMRKRPDGLRKCRRHGFIGIGIDSSGFPNPNDPRMGAHPDLLRAFQLEVDLRMWAVTIA